MNPSPHLPPIGHKRQLTAPPDEDDAVLDEAKVREKKNETNLLTTQDSSSVMKSTKMRFPHEKIIDNIKETMSRLPHTEYGLTAEDLGMICNFDERNSIDLVETLDKQYGGVNGVLHYLRSDPIHGLPLKQIKSSHYSLAKVSPDGCGVNMTITDGELRRKVFGMNKIPPPPSEGILNLIIGQVKEDVILKVLIVGAAVVISLGTAICPQSGWVEGVAILVAVVIVLAVTSGNDWSKDQKFKKLLLLQSEKKVKVLRGGIKDQISSWDLVVGDIIELVPGDEVPADGLFVSGSRLLIDESPLTGESMPVRKSNKEPFLFSGCQVSEGSALMVATAVGVKSSGGQIQKILNEAQKEETVLQEKLKVVAVQIGKIGVAAGVGTFIILATRWAVSWARNEPLVEATCGHNAVASATLARLQELATHFVIGITVVVVAVPEGLPLAVTISLAFSMFKMIRDKCFVRHLNASETMGQATCICTDKTGTLTENRMTVVKALVCTTEFNGDGSAEENAIPFSPTMFSEITRQLIAESICVNSTCFVKYKDGSTLPIFVGSATEGAMLVFASKLGLEYEDVRNRVTSIEGGTWPFSSERKRMSTLVEPYAVSPLNDGHKYRLYSKGASEIVLNLCNTMINIDGTDVTPILPTHRVELQSKIKQWASEGLRTIAIAYKDSRQKITTIEGRKSDDPEHDLTFIGLLGIKDPIRKDVPGAVESCQKAGLIIKMVTGDNILTACKIARECNILTNGVAMEGPTFRSLSDVEKRKVAPQLQVLARSSPTDKFVLVSLLKEMGHVVAVTGDGTNDAPALKEADVGFAMGISGTQIAMNACDIILMDDNFVSIVQSIKWGRNVLESVRKFLQFQLGVNLVAIILTVVGSAVKAESPLNTVQLLWVNLIMDSLGALALASDEPDTQILNYPPHPRTEPLLSIQMRRYILIQTFYQTIVLVALFLGLDAWKPAFDPLRTKSVVFCTFVLLQCTNIIMARQLNGELNVFRRFFKNPIFIIITLVIITIQIIVSIFGQGFIGVSDLDWIEWVTVIVVSALNFPVTIIARLIFRVFDNGKKAKAYHCKKEMENKSYDEMSQTLISNPV